jgi:hypothetical protein
VNVLEIVRAERPSVPPLHPGTRAAVLARVLGSEAAGGVPRVHSGGTVPLSDAATAERERSSWRWLAVAAVVVATVGAIVLIARPSGGGPSAPTSSVSTTQPYHPETVPVIEEMPNPLVVDEPSTAPPTATPSTSPSTSPATSPATVPPFGVTGAPPLVLAAPPAGYALDRLSTFGQPPDVVVVHYVSPATRTELDIVVRVGADVVARFDRAARTHRQIGRFAVVPDEQSEDCLPDVCSVGFAWSDDVWVSLTWTDWYGGDLAPGSTIESLIALVPSVVEDPNAWATAALGGGRGAVRPPGTIYAPGEGMSVELTSTVFAGPPGSRTAALLAPDGSVFTLWVTAADPGAVTRGHQPTSRTCSPTGRRSPSSSTASTRCTSR